jgi:hypothetical protein
LNNKIVDNQRQRERERERVMQKNVSLQPKKITKIY